MAQSAADQIIDAGDIPPVPASALGYDESAVIPVNTQGMGSDLDSFTDKAHKQMEALFPQIATAEKQKAEAQKTEAIGEAKQLESYRKKLESLPAPSAFNPPPQPKAPENNPMQQFGSLASLIGIFASAFTKRPMVNALNSSAAAMNAQRAGDNEAYDRAYKEWQDQVKLALDHHNLEMENLHEILEMSKEDNGAALAQLKAFAVAQQSDAASVLSQLGDWAEIGKYFNSMKKAGTGLNNIKETLFTEGVQEFVQKNGRLPNAEEKAVILSRTEGKGERPLTGNQKEQKVESVRDNQNIQKELDNLSETITKNSDSWLPITGWLSRGTEALEYANTIPGLGSIEKSLGLNSADNRPAQEVAHMATLISDRLPAVMAKMGYGTGAIKEMQNLLGVRSIFTDKEQALRNISEVKEMLQTKANEIKDASGAAGFDIDAALNESKPKPAQSDIDYLKAHKDLVAQFDARFGAGEAEKILGGP